MNITLSKSYGEVVLFSETQFVFEPHHIHAIIGPSGSGKTTLLHCIAGLTTFIGKMEPPIQNFGMVFQEDRLFPYLTVLKNLEIISKNKTRIQDYLQLFQAESFAFKYPIQLSGGEKQRISIIRALLSESDWILMDEPFKSLDYQLKWQLVEQVKEMQKASQKTILLVTHDVEIARYLGYRIHVISDKPTIVVKTWVNQSVGQTLNEQNVVILNELKECLNSLKK